MRGDRLRIGAVARRAGVNIQTLRYYERRGLLNAPERTPSGYREYPAEAVQRYVDEGWRLALAAGWLADRHGYPRDARRHYLRSWWLGGGMRPLVMAAIPSPIRRGTRTLRARIGGM